MLSSVKTLSWQESLPRIVADLVIVHICMLTALSMSVIYQTMNGNSSEAQALVGGFQLYYVKFFWLLAPLFPITFFANGFYTHSRAYCSKYKALVILRGVAISVALFLAVNFFIFGHERIGRSVAIPFAILTATGIWAIRVIKDLFEKHYEVMPRAPRMLATREDRILLLGGTGYIGSVLLRRLLESGRKVRVLDAIMYGAASIQDILGHPNLDLVVGDCRNIGDMVSAMDGVRSIIDLAAIVGDPACEQDRQTALEINYAATRMLIEVAKGHKVHRFLFASSCSVYGASTFEMDEEAEVKPLSLYARTKVESEEALRQARTENFHPIILRFATVFGLSYRPRFDLVVNLLCAQAHQEGVITIYNGEQWRPFIHVKDVVEAIMLMLDSPTGLVSSQIFNVGDRRLNHSLTEVGERIRQAFPNTRVEHVDNTDKRDYRVSFDKIRNLLGFECKYQLEDGIREIKQAFDEKKISNYKDPYYHNQHFLARSTRAVRRSDLDEQIMAAFAYPLTESAGFVRPLIKSA
jgi:nucleoside-diphosphate-sugar epimerase